MDIKQAVVAIWMVWGIYRAAHCLETKTITCRFRGDWCGYTQDPTDDFDWSRAREETSKTLELDQDGYICACRNTTSLRPGSLTRLVSPVYEVMTPSLLSLQFKHFKTEGDGSVLRISVESTSRSPASRENQPVFRPLGQMKTKLPWAMYEGKTDVFGPFQLVIEAEVGYVTTSQVAIDDIILTLYSYPLYTQASSNLSSTTNSSGAHQPLEGENNALTSGSYVTPHDTGLYHRDTVLQEKTADSEHEGVSLCFILAVTSSSLLVIALVIFVFVVLSLSKRKRRYQRFNFGHDYEEIRSKQAYNNKGTSVSAMAIMKERPQPRLAYHNRHTSFPRIQSLSSCLSRMSMRDSLRSSIYAEITETDMDADFSDPGIGNTTTMTTTCTATWDICSSSDGSVSDVTLGGGSDITGPSIHKVYPSLNNQGSQNDSGWVENIIYERTSDYSIFDSAGMSPFGLDRALKGFRCDETATGFKPRQRVHTV